MTTLRTQKEMVEHLNTLRIENGKKALKNCKAAKKDVRLWIIKETAIKVEREAAIKKEEEAKIKLNNVEIITASELAEELGINPKSLRRKLRKLEDKLPPRMDSRKWIFEISVKASLIDILK